MAVMVKNLYRNGMFLYKMNIVAGRAGLNNLAQWAHIIEDDNITNFLHGGELVFTAGILNNRPGWLLSFAQKLHAAGVSALVVSIGTHIKEIAEEVIAYCDRAAMPLFTIPWETKLVDMTRDFCHSIMRNEQTQNDVASTIKNIIFGVGDMDAQILRMERHGYPRESSFCFVGVKTKPQKDADEDAQRDALRITAEKCAKSTNDLFVSFYYQEALVLALVNYGDEDIERFVADFSSLAAAALPGVCLHMGVSANQAGIFNQSANFEKALAAADMAEKRGQSMEFYERLGFYKIIYAVNDKTALRGFYNDTVGKLEKYDRENKTSLTELLKTYLENNGSLQIVADILFVHRNTVTNQLKKIQNITGYNPLDLSGKFMLHAGFYIEDIL